MKRFLFFVVLTAGCLASLSLSASSVFAQASKSEKTVTGSPEAVANSPQTAEANAGSETAAKKISKPENTIKVEIHGFAEFDAIHDDTHSFLEVMGSGPVKGAGTLAGDNGWTQTSTRDSRIGFSAVAPEIDGWKTKGYLEFDFKGYDPSPTYTSAASSITGSPTEASFFYYPTMGIRHAFLNAEKDGWNILVGQYWSLFGFLPDYVLSTVSVSPVMGVLYERTPQVRVSKYFGTDDDLKAQLFVSADRPEQRDSQVPNLNGALRLSFGGIKGRFAAAVGAVSTVPLSVGISGTMRNYVFCDTGVNYLVENQNIWGEGLAVDGLIPVVPFDGKDGASVVLTGEYSVGNGIGDMFPNWTGGLKPMLNGTVSSGVTYTAVPNLDAGIAGYNMVAGTTYFTLVQLSSWNGQIQIHLPKSWGTFLTAGYGELFSPNVGGLASLPGGSPSGAYNDDSVMFANIMHDFTPNIRVAAEYLRVDTHYANIKSGCADALDHRVQVSTWYRF